VDTQAEAALGGVELAPPIATRPTARLSGRELFQISVYWLAINALWGGVDLILLPYLMTQFICGGASDVICAHNERPIFASLVVSKEIALSMLAFAGALVAMAVQPVVAAISDYTITRWGRRKPYIFIGTLLDVVFLAGLAFSNTFLMVLAFLILLQFSSNFAQGPFQGYVPDLVPASQVGLASGLMGLMIILGNFTGLAAVGLAIAALHDYRWSLAAIAVLELSTMLATVLTVREPRAIVPPKRAGSIGDSVRSTVRDVLSHRSFVWLLGSRFFFLLGVSTLTRLALFYMQDSIGLTVEQASLAAVVAGGIILVFNGVSVFPSGRLADRFGRKPMIYAASAIAFAGMLPLVFAQRDPALTLSIALPGGGSPLEIVYPVAGLAVILVGVGFGTFIAVDWALMTDIIPKETTGRYMGISNVATAISGPIAIFTAGLVIAATAAMLGPGNGPRAALLVAACYFVVCALLLRPVDPRRREAVAPMALAAEMSPTGG
jgi:MFS-type transporter involved in bile tolerance (Atg22 family)